MNVTLFENRKRCLAHAKITTCSTSDKYLSKLVSSNIKHFANLTTPFQALILSQHRTSICARSEGVFLKLSNIASREVYCENLFFVLV